MHDEPSRMAFLWVVKYSLEMKWEILDKLFKIWPLKRYIYDLELLFGYKIINR